MQLIHNHVAVYIKNLDGLGINPILKEHKVTPRTEICL